MNVIKGVIIRFDFEQTGDERMPRVVVRENEDLDAAMRRFKRQVNNSGVLAAVRSKEYYVKPGVKRRLKSEAARKKRRK